MLRSSQSKRRASHPCSRLCALGVAFLLALMTWMLFTMSTPSPPVDDLEPQGWSHNGEGEIFAGRPQCKDGGGACFKHTRPLQAKDVWRMRVEVGGYAFIGFATEHYNAEKHGETYESTAYVVLEDGSTVIDTDISQDGLNHFHYFHLQLHIPEAPFDLALRCEAISNVPQIGHLLRGITFSVVIEENVQVYVGVSCDSDG